MTYTASTLRRLFAYMIDSSILGVLTTFPLFLDFRHWFFGADMHLSWARILALILIPFCYRLGFLMGMGATPGKWLLGLKVVDHQTKGELRLDQAALRTLAEYLNFFFHFAPQIIALYRADRRQLGDLLAQTQVVQYFPRAFPAKPRPILATIAILISLSTAGENLRQTAAKLRVQTDGIILTVPDWDDVI